MLGHDRGHTIAIMIIPPESILDFFAITILSFKLLEYRIKTPEARCSPQNDIKYGNTEKNQQRFSNGLVFERIVLVSSKETAHLSME